MIKKMLKGILKRITMVLVATITLTTVKCFAATMTNEEIMNIDNVEYIKRNYSVSEKQEDDFLLNLQNEFKIENKTYQLDDKIRTGGNIVETIDINTSKTITTNTNKIDDILSQLPEKIEYTENNYVGKYILDTSSIDVKSKYNGYKEYLVEDTKVYTELDTNDLDNIPKQVMKDGLVLDLITTNWEVTETRNLQDNVIPSKYKATCYYATKKKVDNPLTYIVKAEYTGTAERTIEKDYNYEITYKCVAEDKNITPALVVLGGSTLLVIVVLLARKKNVIIYNFQNKEWKEIGRQTISKPKIKLDRYNYKAVSNRFKIVIDDKTVDKYNGQMLKIQRQKRTIDKFINKANNIQPYTIDIVI